MLVLLALIIQHLSVHSTMTFIKDKLSMVVHWFHIVHLHETVSAMFIQKLKKLILLNGDCDRMANSAEFPGTSLILVHTVYSDISMPIHSNFNGSNTYGTMEISSRQG